MIRKPILFGGAYLIFTIAIYILVWNFINTIIYSVPVSDVSLINTAQVCIHVAGIFISFLGIIIFYFHKEIANRPDILTKEIIDMVKWDIDKGGSLKLEKIFADHKDICSWISNVNRDLLILSMISITFFIISLFFGFFSIMALSIILLEISILFLTVGIILLPFLLFYYNYEMNKITGFIHAIQLALIQIKSKKECSSQD